MSNQIQIDNIEKYRRVQYLKELKQPYSKNSKIILAEPRQPEELMEVNILTVNENRTFNEQRLLTGYINNNKNLENNQNLMWKA